MGTKRRILFIALFLAVIGVLAWFLLHPREPRYQGRPLSYWVRGLDLYSRAVATNKKVPYDGPGIVESAEAVRQIGTNAFPQLLRMLQEKDSTAKLKVIALVQKQHVIKINFAPSNLHNIQAATALQLLGALGVDLGPIVPDLIKIYDRHISGTSMGRTIGVLESLGPAAELAISSVRRGLTNNNEEVRMASLSAFCRICRNDGKAVTAQLLKSANDASPTVRKMANDLLSGRTSFGISPHAGIWFVPIFKNVSPDERLDRLLMIGPAGREHLEKVGPEVVELLHDGFPVIRQMACIELLQIYQDNGLPDSDVTAAIVETLKDPDPMVRATASKVLKQLDPVAAAKAGVK